MPSGRFLFGPFLLDADDRRLCRDGEPLELNARYFDALALLVGEAGRLVSKDRFLTEVWRGVPVTDEALTQCVRTLRRRLGDDAVRPRYIETVTGHGYRFVAPVEPAEAAPAAAAPSPPPGRRSWRPFLLLGGAGTLGAGLAGAIGGLAYGFAAAAQPADDGIGAASVLLVLLWLTVAAALTGGAGVAFGIAAAGFASRAWWRIVGGAIGGMAVGGAVKLLGLDAFQLLLGRSPGDITGAGEGLLLGGAVGLGAWAAGRARSLRRGLLLAALAGAAAGLVIVLAGGRLMAGSLDLLTRAFPDSRLRFDPLGALTGEAGLSFAGQLATGAMEGALFAGCVVGAMQLARRGLGLPG